jgi:hypothetical protein
MTSQVLATAFAELLTDVADTIASNWTWPSPEAGFALFVMRDRDADRPLPCNIDWPMDHLLVHAPNLAAAGYLLALGQGYGIQAAWLEGVKRLSGREAFPTDRQSFAYRPVELVGIAAGIAFLAPTEADLARWIKKIVVRASREHNSDAWGLALTDLAQTLLNPDMPPSQVAGDPSSFETLCFAFWYYRTWQPTADALALGTQLLQVAATRPFVKTDLARLSVVYEGLRDAASYLIQSESERLWSAGGGPAQDAESVVISICRRFHLFAQQLLRRYDARSTVTINDEYDVQDLMHAILKLHFTDVRPEEVAPSVAGKSGRMDFFLKREKIVVETKMTRRGLDQKKVGDELILDRRRYQAHAEFGTFICFVYDPGGICKTPDALETDLSGTSDGVKMTVIVSPKGL